MGIESDQLVFDYLSRVGDVAQQRQLPSATRMRLVSSLRNEIDKQRAKFGTDSPSAVRRILGRLGTPDEVVDAAARHDGGKPAGTTEDAAWSSPRTAPATPPDPEPAGPSVPEQRSRSARRFIPRPRASDRRDGATGPGGSGPVADSGRGASPVDASSADASPVDASSAQGAPDWWRVEPGPHGSTGDIGGFVGGVEIPDLLVPPATERAGERQDNGGAGGAAPGDHADGAVDGGAPAAAPRRWRPGALLRPSRRTGVRPDRAPGQPMLLFAAALLALGLLLGSWIALAGGWLLAYASRTLSRAEAKWAVLGLPGGVAAGAAVWLWGRVEGRWGDPIAPGGQAMREALATTWPWVVRGAALASALFLVWRARRK
ncbi:hypothetical protein [Streptomyces sp. NPDC059176]|uniref:hypothetical protein n=1 Tax=Streptomyces sp. NPDC059176 TaxID=3346758 RepID=UPI0036CA2A4E